MALTHASCANTRCFRLCGVYLNSKSAHTFTHVHVIGCAHAHRQSLIKRKPHLAVVCVARLAYAMCVQTHWRCAKIAIVACCCFSYYYLQLLLFHCRRFHFTSSLFIIQAFLFAFRSVALVSSPCIWCKLFMHYYFLIFLAITLFVIVVPCGTLLFICLLHQIK